MANNTNTSDLEIKSKDGRQFKVSARGSLGLLALGDLGVIAWRQAREQRKEEKRTRSQYKQVDNKADE